MNLADKARYRGRPEVQTVLSERLFVKDSPKFNFEEILTDTSLGQLLGVYPETSNRVLTNVTPNTLNYILWHIMAKGIAENLCKLTDEKPDGVFIKRASEGLKKLLKVVSRWPDPEAKDFKILETLWLQILQYDAPEVEFKLWCEFVLSDKFTVQGRQALAEILYMLLMNPYFLLKQ